MTHTRPKRALRNAMLLSAALGTGGCASGNTVPAKPTFVAPAPTNPTATLAQSTVTVFSLTEYYDGEMTRSAEGSGSGFVIKIGNEHAIATAAHVLGHATSLDVFHPSGFRTSVTSVLARDDRADIAILKVDGLPPQARPVALVEAEPALADEVVLISSPLGLDTTVAFGTVAAFRPQWRAFQLSAGVSPGSSGGLAATRDGRVLGVIRSKASRKRDGENITLITPARYLRRLLNHIEEAPLPAPPRFDAMQTEFEMDVSLVASGRFKGRLAAAYIDFDSGREGVQHYCAHTDDPAADVAIGLAEGDEWSQGRGFSCASFVAESSLRVWVANDNSGDQVHVRISNQQ